jgi:hypothetical protein
VSCRIRAALIVIAAATLSCSSEVTSRADVAGTWRLQQEGLPELVLRADGGFDLQVGSKVRVPAEGRCRDAAAVLDECGARRYWDRSGAKVRLWDVFVVSNGQHGQILGMFDDPKHPPPCECKVLDPEVFELRDANTMVFRSVKAVRVKPPATNSD